MAAAETGGSTLKGEAEIGRSLGESPGPFFVAPSLFVASSGSIAEVKGWCFDGRSGYPMLFCWRRIGIFRWRMSWTASSLSFFPIPNCSSWCWERSWHRCLECELGRGIRPASCRQLCRQAL